MSVNARRIIAAVIDFHIICFIVTVISYTLVFLTMYISFLSFVVCFILAYMLILFRDNIVGNASIGKKLLKIKVVKVNGEKINLITSLKRNILFFLWPVEILLIITDNKRLGDMWAKTIVVKS